MLALSIAIQGGREGAVLVTAASYNNNYLYTIHLIVPTGIPILVYIYT